MPDLAPPEPSIRPAMAIVAGYLAACLSVVILFFGAADAASGDVSQLTQWLRAMAVSFAIVLALALPGYAICRLVLGLLGRKDWPGFVIAGGLNGAASVLVLRGYDGIAGAGTPVTSMWDIMPGFVVMGLLAGLASWSVETLIRR